MLIEGFAILCRGRSGRCCVLLVLALTCVPSACAACRYKGEGRVAQAGYRNAHWVDGELLQFSGSSPMTSGAELGFVWSVPGEKRFLILLNKVDLEGL